MLSIKKHINLSFVSVLGSVILACVVFGFGFKLEYPNRDLFSLFKDSPVQSTMTFEDISTIDIYADNIDLIILETDRENVLVKNSVKTTGKGVITEPKIWVSDNTLFYDQGLIMDINTWEIIEDAVDFNTYTSGNLIIEVPKNVKFDFNIKNPNGTLDFNVENSSGTLDFNIIPEEQQKILEEHLVNACDVARKSGISLQDLQELTKLFYEEEN